MTEATTEALLEKVAVRHGRMVVSHDWLELQLEAKNELIETLSNRNANLEHELQTIKLERDRMAKELADSSPKSEPHQTPRVAMRKGKA